MNRVDREARKAAKTALKKEKGLKLREALLTENDKKTVKSEFTPTIDKTPKSIGSRMEFIAKKTAIFNVSPSVYQSPMTWCAEIADIVGHWSWREARAWNEVEWDKEICRTFNQLEGNKWSEISSMKTGNKKKRRKLHHSQEVDSLAIEAKKRWLELGLEQFDTVYRFRLGGTKRAWGYPAGSHFCLVWYEREHRIYPLK